MTPERAKAVENPNRWIFAFNLIVRMLELSTEKFDRISFDWRISYAPNFKDAEKHIVDMLLIAKDPNIWQQPALMQQVGITREEMDTLVDSEARLYELIAARIEVAFRALIQLLFENNPEQKDRIARYL